MVKKTLCYQNLRVPSHLPLFANKLFLVKVFSCQHLYFQEQASLLFVKEVRLQVTTTLLLTEVRILSNKLCTFLQTADSYSRIDQIRDCLQISFLTSIPLEIIKNHRFSDNIWEKEININFI